MRKPIRTAFLALLFCTAGSSGYPQLRYNSDYALDRVNPELTSFTLHDTGAAEYQCASEWTTLTVQTNLTKTAMFLWHFNDGTKAFARQVEYVGDIGARTDFLMVNQFSNLEDKLGKKVQPMTRENFPVKVEVWIGEFGESGGYSPEILVDKACFDLKSIEMNHPYSSKACL